MGNSYSIYRFSYHVFSGGIVLPINHKKNIIQHDSDAAIITEAAASSSEGPRTSTEGITPQGPRTSARALAPPPLWDHPRFSAPLNLLADYLMGCDLDTLFKGEAESESGMSL